jgi:hypothetical protein
LEDVLERFQLTDRCLNVITTDNAFSDNSMTSDLQLRLEASEIKWPGLRHHIPRLTLVGQRTVGAVMSNLVVQGHTESWEAHEGIQQFGEYESIDIGNSQ